MNCSPPGNNESGSSLFRCSLYLARTKRKEGLTTCFLSGRCRLVTDMLKKIWNYDDWNKVVNALMVSCEGSWKVVLKRSTCISQITSLINITSTVLRIVRKIYSTQLRTHLAINKFQVRPVLPSLNASTLFGQISYKKSTGNVKINFCYIKPPPQW